MADAGKRQVRAGDEVTAICRICKAYGAGRDRRSAVDVEGNEDVGRIELDVVAVDHVTPEDEALTVIGPSVGD